MASDLITVLIIGHNDPDIDTKLRWSDAASYEADDFSVLISGNDTFVRHTLTSQHVSIICTFGKDDEFPTLCSLPLEYRRRWLHFEDKDFDPKDLAVKVLECYLGVSTRKPFPDTPLVSVFTPTYKTGKDIVRVYRSLARQTYSNWEWVVYDDSPDTDTYELVTGMSDMDPRIKVFRSSTPCGVIGEVKRRCVGLTKGEILVELDHDDELTSNCLQDLVEAFKDYPDAGFAYTDCAEVFDDGENATYGETYAFGFGSYRYEEYNGKTYAVSNYPSVNAKTVRHIVGMPNHVRAWRREAYYAAGGHSPEIHVADDYELCIRTFLTTRMIHINKLGYIQTLNRSGSNTQRVRNKEIQRLVRLFSQRYEQEIHQRFEELEVNDFIWTENGNNWSLDPSGNFKANYDWPNS